jgi:hypothetical protein
MRDCCVWLGKFTPGFEFRQLGKQHRARVGSDVKRPLQEMNLGALALVGDWKNKLGRIARHIFHGFV